MQDDMAELWHLLGTEIGSYESALSGHETTGILDRTMPGRLADHNILLRDAGRNRPLARRLGLGGGRHLFFDIGPAVANDDTPAQSAFEIARGFPDTQVVCVDTPRAVERFRRNANRPPQKRLLTHPNLTIIAGDGRDSLRALVARGDSVNGRRIGTVDDDTTVIIRAANSLDIYCNRAQNEDFVRQKAEEFKNNATFLLFNRAILKKKPGTMDWRLIGRISSRGFNHKTRAIAPYGPQYEAAYELYAPARQTAIGRAAAIQ